MEKAIIGKKVGMTQIFDADGKVIPVTVVEAGPCTVVQKKTVENDGYEAVQMGYQPVAERKLNKPELGHLAKVGVEPMKVLKEFRLNDCSTVNVGDVRPTSSLRASTLTAPASARARATPALSSVTAPSAPP